MSEITITLNGKEYKADSNNTVLETAQKNDIKIPTLCHDPRLEPYSSCYVCVVEIEGTRGLQPACSTKVSEGMIINTNNSKVRISRKSALELLVSDHFADCAAPCKETCPAGVDVQGYISLIEKGLYHEAVKLIKEVNPLPSICGRVCVRPCEAACNRNFMEEESPVGIDYMKRFVSDFDLYTDKHYIPKIAEATSKKIAIIGAGPGGLSSAYFLRQKGHSVDIFEANNHAGGWLRYGIPEYRLPNNLLDKEISTVTELGVKIYLNKKLGKSLSYSQIQDTYDSTILTIGSQLGTLLGADGEDADGVFSGIDFLRNMEQTGQKYDFSGKTVAVVGGGNTAMDCCRTSIRCNAEKTYVIYRRTEKEMPANPIEIHESKLEGVEYLFLTNPTKVNASPDGKVKSITCIKMQLGEPDASGRRRPVEIPGSEFELEVNYILAAIGQKTDVNFIKDINENTRSGELKINRWGDIEADPLTLQTGISSIFAAGDGVTGPATIIEAIMQAKIASESCHQYLISDEIKPKSKEFLSKKTNFKKLTKEDFIGKFEKQKRQEMPVLDSNERFNFNEVELGYSEKMALEETKRCFECGCSEYFTCDLKNLCSDYHVDQKHYEGEFHERAVDFSHPYIEIDNNKCILCSRCIRICNDVVGASALGLINRGFETFVAPSMGKSLTETNCESCGLCISTCPTGAINENFKFKAGPVKTQAFETISNYDSSGEKITIHHRNSFVMKVTGSNGKVNKDSNIGRHSKFGYQFYNDTNRITKPLIKKDGKFVEISFEEAFNLIKENISKVKDNENAFFAGARLTNEEQYLIKKLAADAIKTKNIGSFHYLGRGNGYDENTYKNVPFEQIKNTGKIYILGSDLNYNNGLINFFINNAKTINNTEITLITEKSSKYKSKADEIIKVKSYYYFIKAVQAYITENEKQNQLFIDDNCSNFEEFKDTLSKFNLYSEKAGLSTEFIAKFAEEYNKEQNAVIIFEEKEVSSNCSLEIQNLAMITGKLGKTSSGIIAVKEKNNSHGLFDNNCIANDALYEGLEISKFKNLFVFGEDPIGCAIDKNKIERMFVTPDFMVVQDYFMTETAKKAHLILPASFPTESGGSYTNTQRILQSFKAELKPKTSKTNHEQLLGILSKFGKFGLHSIEDVFLEAASKLPEYPEKFNFKYTPEDNKVKLFNYGCDILNKRFEEEFEKSFN